MSSNRWSLTPYIEINADFWIGLVNNRNFPNSEFDYRVLGCAPTTDGRTAFLVDGGTEPIPIAITTPEGKLAVASHAFGDRAGAIDNFPWITAEALARAAGENDLVDEKHSVWLLIKELQE